MQPPSIKDKLRELSRVHPYITTTKPEEPTNLDALLEGREDNGCFYVERRLALNQAYGLVTLSELLSVSGAALGIACKSDGIAAIDLREVLFIDTETTGLAGGSGTLAFLVGLGYFEENELVVRQLFLRRLSEEGAMLSELQQQMGKSKLLVTFNGKSFDVPLLVTRMVMSRMRASFNGLPHLDVLHAARRLWKDVLPECSLTSLEHSILGVNRTHDVPGELIPQIYYDFVRTGRVEQLPLVLAHNRQDILATAALLAHLGRLVQSPFKHKATMQELRNIGRLYQHAGELETSGRLLETLLEQNSTTSSLEDHLALGFCYKSQRRYAEACQVWQRTVDMSPFHPLPFIEYAKHLEHRMRDYDAAHALVLRALRSLSMLSELRASRNLDVYESDLRRREERLRRKLSQNH